MKPAQVVNRSILVAPVSGTVTAAGTLEIGGADYATIEVALSKRVDATVTSQMTVAITEGDVSTGSFVTFNASASQTVTLDDADSQLLTFHVNNNGERKKYLKVTLTPGTVASADAVVAAVVANVVGEISPLGTVGQGTTVVVA